MQSLSERTAGFTDSVIRRMTRISDATPGSINLSQGFPDFDPPQVLLDALREMAGGGEQHQYSVTYGSENLRRCIAEKYSPIHGYEIDPETQVVLPLLESDLLTIMQACRNGTLAETEVKFSDGAACCVIMASSGYPEHYEKGFAITMPAETAAHTYVAGAKREEDRLLTSGGRVLGVTATAADLKSAIEKAYERVESVHFDNAFYRHDIGQRALKALEH